MNQRAKHCSALGNVLPVNDNAEEKFCFNLLMCEKGQLMPSYKANVLVQGSTTSFEAAKDCELRLTSDA